MSLTWRSAAQENGEYTQSRILFLLDESSSMLQTWANGKEKYKIANELIERLMDSVNAVNSNVQFSLRVFGNQHTVPEHDCYDTRNEVPFSADNRTQMSFRLDDLRPLGVTAIAYSLSEAAEKDLVDEVHNAYSIILITDGGESCNGDICGVMQKLVRNKVFFRPYVLSLEDVPELKTEYACMGDYLTVTKMGDMTRAVNTIVNAFRPMLRISKSDYTKLQTIAAKAPSALKVHVPAIVATVPEVVKPTPKPVKPVDTVVVPVPKPSNIVVGEEQKRPAPVKLKKAVVAKLLKLKAPRYSIEPFPTVAVVAPEIKVSEDLIAVRPAPVTLKRIKMPAMRPSVAIRIAFAPLAMVVATPPDIKVELPVVHPAVVSMIKIRAGKYKPLPVKHAAPYVATPVAEPAYTVNVDRFVVPVRPPSFKVESIAVTGLKKLNTNAPAKPKAVKVTPPVLKVPEPDVVVPVVPPAPAIVRKPLKMTKNKPGAFRMHLLYVNTFLDSDLKPIAATPPVFKHVEPDVPAPKPVPPAVVKQPKPTKPVTKPTTPPETPKTGEYTQNHEEANETTMQVYLTNGKGKFYSTTPRVVIIDPATKKEIKRFYRTVDEKGEPDLVENLPVGKYDLMIVGRDDLLAHVDMQQNKHNKVFIKVRDFSLFFYYTDAPKRPVEEFTATVIQRNVDNGKVTVQKCTQRLEYEPGNYHIVINTYPEERRNVDLDALGAGGIAISQPGFARFIPEGTTTAVNLYRELGDKFLQFDTINLGDPKSQHLQIQPGKYQAHYSNGATKYSTSERVVTFLVTSNKQTDVSLPK